ncbi:MAG: hypothetical protein JETCAE02_26980 [Anaerolineaceae bacterium]|nr:MAG: hypothetical protein JETCAE02_26980 [Anaerolineaceae bacterium]
MEARHDDGPSVDDRMSTMHTADGPVLSVLRRNRRRASRVRGARRSRAEACSAVLRTRRRLHVRPGGRGSVTATWIIIGAVVGVLAAVGVFAWAAWRAWTRQ